MIQSTICDEKSDLWAYGCILYEMFVGSYLHIEFDTQQIFQSEMANRLPSFTCAVSSLLDSAQMARPLTFSKI